VGGIYCFQCSPAVYGNTFHNNSSGGVGAIYCLESSPEITENVFNGNSGLVGGICAAMRSGPLIANNQITGNRASYYCGYGNLVLGLHGYNIKLHDRLK